MGSRQAGARRDRRRIRIEILLFFCKPLTDGAAEIEVCLRAGGRRCAGHNMATKALEQACRQLQNRMGEAHEPLEQLENGLAELRGGSVS